MLVLESAPDETITEDEEASYDASVELKTDEIEDADSIEEDSILLSMDDDLILLTMEDTRDPEG